MSSLFAIVMVFCVGLSIFFSGMEAGVFALSRLRVRRLMRHGNTNARVLHRFLAAPEDFLWTILVGNTVCNFAIVAVAVFASRHWLREHPGSFAALLFLGVLVFYGACELFPKMLFRLYPNRLCLLLARPFRWTHVLLKPLVAVVRWLATGLMRWSGGRTFTGHLFGSRDELRRLMQESARELSTEERSMIERVLDLQSSRIGDVMVPMPKAVTVTAEMSVGEAMAVCRDKGLSRLPVWQEAGGARRIAGLFTLRSTIYSAGEGLDPGAPVSRFIRPATFVDVDTRLDEAMRHLQRSGQRLAIVLARDRREVGIVSLQDVLKPMFGQVRL
jgi:putative hemolysin